MFKSNMISSCSATSSSVSVSAKEPPETAGIMDISLGSDGEKSERSERSPAPHSPTFSEDMMDCGPPSIRRNPSHPSGQPSKMISSSGNNNFKFSIENILRPDFGSSRSQPMSLMSKSRTDSSNEESDFQRSQNFRSLLQAELFKQALTSTCGIFSSTPVPPISPTLSKSPSQESEKQHSPGPATGKPVVNPAVAQAPNLFPAWVYCTRYSDRPSSGRPRCRKVRQLSSSSSGKTQVDEKRPRTAFSAEQLSRLKTEFQENRYLTEKRRQDLANELGLKESQIKIWFQNKRAKIKKQSSHRHPLALHLLAQGLYNHSTIPIDDDMSSTKTSPSES